MIDQTQFKSDLSNLLSNLEDLLLAKNKAYGNSALKPLNVFSKASSEDVIRQQIDHKLSRIVNADETTKNDTVDLIGYLILFCISKDWIDFEI